MVHFLGLIRIRIISNALRKTYKNHEEEIHKKPILIKCGGITKNINNNKEHKKRTVYSY